MTEMSRMHEIPGPDVPSWTVGQVAEQFGVTVRTLHHYDEIGLLVPSGRTAAGYRLYTNADVTRLRHVVVYRRLGFSLEEIAAILDDPTADIAAHLRRQRDAVMSRLGDLNELVAALDRALEAQMSGNKLTEQEQRELFGDHFDDAWAEAEQRWGETDAWRQSQQRATAYTKDDWAQVKAEETGITAAFVDAMRAGESPSGIKAMDAAEAHRLHIHRRFYDLGYPMHRGLGDMYVSDPRFTATYDAWEPGLAAYIRDAIHANADRREDE